MASVSVCSGVLLHVAGVEHAGRTEGFDALVVAVTAAARVGDHAEFARGGLQHRARGIDIAEAADFRIDQATGGGVDLHRLLAQQPARHVQVVDGEVLEQAAAGGNETGRRRGRIVVDQLQRFQLADRAGVELLLQRLEVRIEAAVEAEQEARAFEARARLQHFLQVQVDGLLAEHRLAGLDRGQRVARCWSVELQTSTPLTDGSASACSRLAACAPKRWHIASATSGRGSTTYFSRRPGCRAAFGPCTWPMRPAPISATSILSTIALRGRGWPMNGSSILFHIVIEFPGKYFIFQLPAGAGSIPLTRSGCMAESNNPPGTAEELRAAILVRYESLSKRLQQIARYVLDEPNAMALETLAVLAERTRRAALGDRPLRQVVRLRRRDPDAAPVPRRPAVRHRAAGLRRARARVQPERGRQGGRRSRPGAGRVRRGQRAGAAEPGRRSSPATTWPAR